jgi:hypothetical protein
MSHAGRGVGLLLAAGLLLTGCSGSGQSSASTAAASASASPSADALTQWCNSYAVITQVLADSGTTSAGAPKALLALDRYAKLWQLAGESEIIGPDETNANLRAVTLYRKVIQLLADGAAENSPDVEAAKTTLSESTQNDHDLLASSAGAVLGLCGAPTASPTPSLSSTG